MTKTKLTKGELKKQRDSLQQYLKYLPTLQLKKQQLQIEILHQTILLQEKEQILTTKKNAALTWLGLLAADPYVNISQWLKPKRVIISAKNIAGIDLPVFERLEFVMPEYDLFLMPLWLDAGIEALRIIVSLREEIEVIKKEIAILRHELRITTQRVNLFEKVKIPEAEEAIRVIKIYLGDQMANAVGRSKIAKRKIEQAELEEVLV